MPKPPKTPPARQSFLPGVAIRFLMFLGVVVLLATISNWSERLGHNDGGTLLFPKLGEQLDQVAAVTIRRGPLEAKLVKKDNDWVVASKQDFPAETVRLRALLLSVANLQKLEAKTKDPANHAQLNVEDQPAKKPEDQKTTTTDEKTDQDKKPAADEKAADQTPPTDQKTDDKQTAEKKDDKKAETIPNSVQLTIADASDKILADVLLGKMQTAGAKSGTAYGFVRLAGDPQVWLVDGLAALPNNSTLFLRGSLIDMPLTSVKSLSITQPETADAAENAANQPKDAKPKPAETKPKWLELQIGHEEAEKPLAILNQPPSTELLSDKMLPGIASSLAFMEFEDVRKVAERPLLDSAGHGFGTSRFTSFTGLIITATWSTTPSENGWVAFAASTTDSADETAKQAAASINQQLGPWLVKLPGFKYDLLTSKMESLVVKAIDP
jgi:outer membrane biosynthesis protein TonB